MNSKRKTMLVAAFVVAVVALAGVGYAAATGYTAKTTVSDNTIGDSKYIVIKTNDADYSAAFSGSYVFNTETSYDDTYNNNAGSEMLEFLECYSIVNGQKSATASDYVYFNVNASNEMVAATNTTATYKGVKVLDSGETDGLTVTVDFSNASDVSASLETTIATITDGTNGVDLYFTYKVGNNAEKVITLNDNGKFTIPNLTPGSNENTVSVVFNIYDCLFSCVATSIDTRSFCAHILVCNNETFF